jgi:hypothetical protein
VKTPARAWSTPTSITERLQHDWDSGKIPEEVVRAAAAGVLRQEAGSEEPREGFPLRIPIRGPATRELGEAFDEARRWIAALAEAEGTPGFQLEWRDFNHRQLGQNRVPAAAVFKSLDDILACAGKRREAARLSAVCLSVLDRYPSLLPWLLRRPLEALEREREWPAMLATLDWFRLHPRSGRYLRQVDAPGVHSKFVEGRRGIFSELLDLVLEPDAIESDAKGSGSFVRRYGLLDKPVLVRLRSLDEGTAIYVNSPKTPAMAVTEIALRQYEFATLFSPGESPFEEMFITENEVNYLSFPTRNKAAVVLGGGYGFSHIAGAVWLHGTRIRYWGDLDTHGFAILDQFRSTFPGAESFLMDRNTLLAHRELWTTEPNPTHAELQRLGSEEASLYNDLRHDKLSASLRLEQERIRFSWVETALDVGEQ